MALKQADRLESNNPKAFGIARATEISGHRAVTTLINLYEIPDCILSDSKDNTNNDAIGQEWYVISEKSKYILVDWEKRRGSEGWKKYVGTELGNILAGDRIQIDQDLEHDTITISADSEIDDTSGSSSETTWSIDKIREVLAGRGVKQVQTDPGDESSIKLEVDVDNTSIDFDEQNKIGVRSVDGGIY